MPDAIRPTAPTMTEAKVDSAATDTILVAGLAGYVIRVYQYFSVQDANAVLTFLDGVVALTGPITMFAGGAIFMPYSLAPWFTTTEGADLVLHQSAAAQLSGRIYYLQTLTGIYYRAPSGENP